MRTRVTTLTGHEPRAVAKNEAAHAIRMKRCNAKGGATADGIAQKNGALEIECIERAAQKVRIVRDARRPTVVRRKSVAGPIERDDLESVADQFGKGFEVACAMTYRMQADHRFSVPTPHGRKPGSVRVDPGHRLGCAKGGSLLSARRHYVIHLSLPCSKNRPEGGL